MPGRRRSNGELARDRRRIADLYLQGWIQADIADELGIDQSTVSRDLQTLYDDWRQSALVDINEAKAEELAKVDRLEREFWAAWLRSCEDAETVKQKGKATGDGSKPQVTDIEKTAKGQAGDPRFLQGVQWCINKRCEILGIDAPKNINLGGQIAVIGLGVDVDKV